jgi:uncharacterized protein YuzE
MTQRNIIKVPAKRPPVVELDSDAHAAYVRFSHHRVKQTKVVTEDECIITIDLDMKGDVLGVELVGVKEFNISWLLKMAGITAPKLMLDRASYVPAKLQAA